MIRFLSPALRAGAAATAFAVLAGAAQAQGSPPLPSMPPPPSAAEPTPKAAATKAKPKKAGARRTETGPGRAGNAAAVERPGQYVQEEFDRGGSRSGGGSVRPFVTESGRPGMGMRF